MVDWDADGSGSIDFEQFLYMMSSKARINKAMQGDKKQLKRLFELFDDQKTGYLSIANLRRLARSTGEGIPEQDLDLMIKYADRDGDGFVSEQQFYNIFIGDLSPNFQY